MAKKSVIETIKREKRTSTQELLQLIYKQMEEGCREFVINAAGQHDIGGPLWTNDGKEITFIVRNPGQRVGSMGMFGTKIIVEGSAPADVGWLNSGAQITVKGDGGDTSAHCAASGKIFIGGRVGTRSGALMKYDPKYPAPEFWVLKNTGSFSFEFMSGGTAVVCGWDSEEFDSVLGSRSCVGMVGGIIYVRGPVKNVSEEVFIVELDDKDKEFLSNGLKEFLSNIDKDDLYKKLTKWSEWSKIVPKTYEQREKPKLMSIKDFREKLWIKGGIFEDVLSDDLKVSGLVSKGDGRLRTPSWENHANSAPCESGCPLGIPTQQRISLIRNEKLKEAVELILDYTPFPASVCGNVCPNLCMEQCNRELVDEKIKVPELGMMSKDVKVAKPKITKKEKIAIIGSGAAGLSCAWQLVKNGYKVKVFEQDKKLGGKLSQVIPADRLAQDVLNAEIERLKTSGIEVQLNTKVTNKMFADLQKEFDAVVIAVGAHNPVVIPFEGHEKLVKGLDFLKKINNGEKVTVGKKVVVIGAGNAAMDVVIGAYKSGAKKVTAIDIQKPAAFEKEIKHAKNLGADILWPCHTDKITEKGVLLKDGTLLEADTVIISVGDRAEFSFLENSYLDEKGRVLINDYMQSEISEKVFVSGDAIRQGLFVDALADGLKIAKNIDKMFNNLELDNFEKAPMLPRDMVKPEFYQGYSATKVAESEPQNEKDRCLSCGLCRDCEFCLNACPENAIERIVDEAGNVTYVSNEERCIGCGICAGVCPCGIWVMKDNFVRQFES